MQVVDLQLDGINLPSLPFVEVAFTSTEDISRANVSGLDFTNATRVDNPGDGIAYCLTMLLETTSLH